MKERNYGIDLLKSVSMLMIVILHILGVGGILAGTGGSPASSNVAWLLETTNICAVNCFGLVSGYVLSKGHYRRSRLMSLWLRVVFESLIITATFAIILPIAVKTQDWINVFTPVINEVYWYFTAYFALFFFVPYLNKMIAALSRRELISLAVSVVFVFTILENVSHSDVFHLHGGYCFLWLLLLYVLGACIRNVSFKESFSKYRYLAAYFLCVILAWGGMLLLKTERVISYTSPIILLASVLLLLFFRRLKFNSLTYHKIISVLSRTSFGVYIIHTHPLIWNNLLAGRFAFYLNFPIPVTVITVIFTAVAIYLICTFCDWLAEKFFKLVRIDLLEAAVDRIKPFKNTRISQNTAVK